MQIAEIAHHPELGPALAAWHAAAWGHLYRHWDEAAAVAEFAAMDTPGRVPTTYLAFDGVGRTVDDLLGSVSLIDDDELDGWRAVGPWLASLYVVPSARGRGVGTALTRLAVDRARALGIERLHLFTAGQEDFYAALGWRSVGRAPAGDETATVMAISTSPHGARAALVTQWCTDPATRTAYSYLRAGGTPADRDLLAEPVAPGLVLAGEATWRDHPGTLHGAWFSGERAAERVLAGAPRTAAVVGAGLAGIAAAQRLRAAGVDAVVFETGSDLGGRARSDHRLGPVNLGGAWAHGTDGNPVAAAAAALGFAGEPRVWDRVATFVVGRGALDDRDAERLGDLYDRFEARMAEASAATTDAGDVVGPVARAVVAELAGNADDHLVLTAWARAEFENLYAASVDDLSLAHCQEPFRLPGPDTLVLGPVGEIARHLAAGLTVRLGATVRSVARTDDGRWRLTVDPATVDPATVDPVTVDAVVVTVPIGVLQAGTIAFSPPLPPPVVAAAQRIGAGRVAKVVATFDDAFWAPHRAFYVVAEPPEPLTLWVDVSAVGGRPLLCAFATGDAAVAVEALDEDALCALVDGVLRRAGVAPALSGRVGDR